MEATYQRTKVPPFLIWIALLVAILSFVQAIVALDHAQLKHGDTVTWVTQQCYDGSGTIYSALTRPSDGRKAIPCEMDGQWFVRITEADGKIVTQFPKDKFKTLLQVLRYLANTGYLP